MSTTAELPRASSDTVERLLSDLHHLPGQQPALMRVAQLAADLDAPVRAVAEACAADPAFTARLLRAANSAHYARGAVVTSLVPAITRIGLSTVRSMALAMALGLSGEHGRLPVGFLERASVIAVASALAAPAVGADRDDALCAGLLADVGQALLHRAAPGAYGALAAAATGDDLAAAERSWCGLTHAELSARAMAASGVPTVLTDAIATHHDVGLVSAGPTAGPLTRALRAGVLIGQAVDTGDLSSEALAELPGITRGALDEAAGRSLALQAASEAAALTAALR